MIPIWINLVRERDDVMVTINANYIVRMFDNNDGGTVVFVVGDDNGTTYRHTVTDIIMMIDSETDL